MAILDQTPGSDAGIRRRDQARDQTLRSRRRIRRRNQLHGPSNGVPSGTFGHMTKRGSGLIAGL
ncbi:hypothetical protein CKO40_16915 [Halochromatium glycolicum]|uniref:Uncharacterized protein n=1 Tax=Halochromatium glycolicum TaxID=85075 RepID=A0AAJ0U6H5_9GAMM|nr:hypothetical protein [Halochromatium glycolicum]